jgi:hypothetical protein
MLMVAYFFFGECLNLNKKYTELSGEVDVHAGLLQILKRQCPIFLCGNT